MLPLFVKNAANANQELFIMTPGDFADQVKIPTYLLSYQDCQKIKTAITSGETINGTLEKICNISPDYSNPNIVWGIGADADGYRGDFKDGLNGWSTDNPGTWEWEADGVILGGAWGGAELNSWSACDGMMKFNSDYLDSKGSQTQSGIGPCPAICTGSLISPNISLPDGIDGLTLEFTQVLRQFTSKFYIMTSRNGGSTWSDTIQINTEFETNGNTINQRKKVALKGFKDASQIRFKFEYQANYYYWGIDDILLLNEAAPDVQVNRNFYAVAPNLRVPASQVAPMYFLADVSNIGNLDAQNTKLKVQFKDQNGGIVGEVAQDYNTLTSGQTVENVLFQDTYTLPPVPQLYEGAYVISSDETDGNEANNQASFYVEVTDKTFGNLFPEGYFGLSEYMNDIASFWVTSPTNYTSAGNVFYVPKGEGYYAEKVRFGLGNPSTEIDGGGFIRVDLYEWEEQVLDGVCEYYERILVGTNNIYLEDIPNFRNIEIPLWRADEGGQPDEGKVVPLKNNTNYLVIAHTEPIDPSFPRFKLLAYTGLSLDNPYDRSLYPEATNYALEAAGIERKYGTLWNTEGLDTDDISERDFYVFGNRNAPYHTFTTVYLEMDINELSSTYNLDKVGEANVFPNPAGRELYIDITLDNASDVKVELLSIEGKIATSKSFSNVKDSRLRLDLSDVPAGAFTAVIHTNKGIISKKVIVQK
ncbi:MAG: T9SS type A sorting domain-containing protein [Chitinophagales bacterium]|nr:T9SS type A sorting domain-containing protein [Chitinophagales bacterium]